MNEKDRITRHHRRRHKERQSRGGGNDTLAAQTKELAFKAGKTYTQDETNTGKEAEIKCTKKHDKHDGSIDKNSDKDGAETNPVTDY